MYEMHVTAPSSHTRIAPLLSPCCCAAFGVCCRAVWPGVKVELCDWHVKRSWLKQLIMKVPGAAQADLRVEMFYALSDIMYGATISNSATVTDAQLEAEVTAEVEAFCQEYEQHAPLFVQYFRTYWQDRPGEMQCVCAGRGGMG